jgi:hypothetical protein
MTVRKIDYPNTGGGGTGEHPRVESGAVQFGDDWRGLFLRGDHCMELVLNLKAVLTALEAVQGNETLIESLFFTKPYLEGLVETIEENVFVK